MPLLQTIAEGLLQLLCVVIILIFARADFEKKAKPYLLMFALLFLLDATLIRALNISVFTGQQWNWVGKAASLLWAVIFIYTTRLVTKEDAGWTASIANRRSVLFIIAAFLVMRLLLRFFLQGFSGGYNAETFAYEATLPGLSEELVFRGIFLALLNKAFPPGWTFGKTIFGWGLVLTSVLFGLVHGFSLSKDWMPEFNSQRFCMTGGLGFVLGYVKEKSKSLVPGILFHNLWNLIAFWGR